MRREFEMTEAQFRSLMEACRPAPYMVFGGVEPESPQTRANRAWRVLGSELGFVWDTVVPAPGKGERFFTAEVAPPATPAASEKEGAEWLIWSFEHDAWWAPDERGYTPDAVSAGRYSRVRAEEIVRNANRGCTTRNETMVPVSTPLPPPPIQRGSK